MKIYVTTCCRKKIRSGGLIKASKIYLSRRIDFVLKKSLKDRVEFRILSAKYGLLDVNRRICYYDRHLTMTDIPSLKKLVVKQIKEQNIDKIFFFMKNVKKHPDWSPYLRLISSACAETLIPLVRVYFSVDELKRFS